VTEIISRQTRTPSTLKWLLNERAAIAGEVEKATARTRVFDLKIAAHQARVDALNSEALPFRDTLAQRQATLAAMDTAISICCQEVNAAAAGTVHAWAGRYGKWGGMRAFVLKTIQDAAPLPVRSPEVLRNLVAHFCIIVATPCDRAALRRSLKSTFQHLKNRGLIEPLHDRTSPAAPGIWRLKQPTTLADLAEKAAAMPEASADGLLSESQG
jgi:hypothetical protein